MTREEAIKILEEEAEFLYGGDEPYNKTAFDMAIEALQNEYTDQDLRDCFDDGYNTAKALKSERHGEWEKIPKHLQMCSECSFVMSRTNEADFYCPNCGADMRGDKHEID